MRKAILVSALIFAALSLGASAEAGTIMIDNETGGTIVELYISDSGTDNWEEDVLGDNILEAGDSLRLTVNGSYAKFDMNASDEDGITVEWYGLPGNVSRIKIYADGTAEYQ